MTWILNNLPLIGERTLQHLAISIPPIILSFVLSIPIGWAANRYRWSRGTLLTLCGLLYAVPSFPLFVVIPVVIGTGLRDPVNIVVALTLYGIALMVRTTADGLASVDSSVIQSATATGYSPWRMFWRVELPLSGPVLIAGLRVVSLSTVSLTTVGALLGIESLGLLFTDGFQRNITAEIYTGIVLTIVIALVFDIVIVALGRILLPWQKIVSPRRVERAPRRAGRAVSA